MLASWEAHEWAMGRPSLRTFLSEAKAFASCLLGLPPAAHGRPAFLCPGAKRGGGLVAVSDASHGRCRPPGRGVTASLLLQQRPCSLPAGLARVLLLHRCQRRSQCFHQKYLWVARGVTPEMQGAPGEHVPDF